MKIYAIAAICVSMLLDTNAAADVLNGRSLVLEAGQRYSLPNGMKSLDLSALTLKDDAVLVLPSDAEYFFIRGENVSIGRNVHIIGSATLSAQNGESGVTYLTGSKNCETPKKGERGAHGTGGADAIDLGLEWNLTEFGSLTIELQGSNGGNGGNGGRGQDADQDIGCPSTPGGDGGLGGDAGKGGAGGDLTLTLQSPSNTLALRAREGMTILNKAGESGSPGIGGEAGSGSVGRYINRKTLTGSRKWVAGGEPGNPGAIGAVAQVAEAGNVAFRLSSAASVLTPVTNVPPNTDLKLAEQNTEARIKRLESTVATLMKRIEALERAQP